MPETIERIKARWAAEGVASRPGASPEALAAFEARNGVVLPPAARDYFASVDGTGDDSDGECFEFWPLDRVVPISEYGLERGEPSEFDHWFLFADFLIHSHAFAIRLSPDPLEGGPVAFVDGAIIPCSPSFEAFLERYLADRPGLRYYDPPAEAGPSARDDGGSPTC